MNNLIKIEYVNWLMKNQDKVLKNKYDLWPFTTAFDYKFNVTDFITHSEIRLSKISDKSFNILIKYLSYSNFYIGYTQQSYFNINDNCIQFIQFLYDIRKYMENEVYCSQYILINDKLTLIDVGENIQFYPVYVTYLNDFILIPAVYILFGTNISNLFIKKNKFIFNDTNKLKFNIFYETIKRSI